MLRQLDDFERDNVRFLELHGVGYGLLGPTKTGIGKHHMDATAAYRNFLSSHAIHDYEGQPWGAKNSKRSLPLKLIDQYGVRDLPDAHLYRARTRGDRRINLPSEGDYLSGGEILVSIWVANQLYLLNASRLSFADSPELLLLIQDRHEFEPIRALLSGLARPGVSDVDLLHLAETALLRVVPGGLRIAVGKSPFIPGKLGVGILDPDQPHDWDSAIVILMCADSDRTHIVLELCRGLELRLDHEELAPALDQERGQPLAQRDPSAHENQFDEVVGTERVVNLEPLDAEHSFREVFELRQLPSESTLSNALQHMCSVYQDVILVSRSGSYDRKPAQLENVSSQTGLFGGVDEIHTLRQFKPRSRDDYLVHHGENSHEYVADRHEFLLRQYAEFAGQLGYQPANVGVHPRDLTLIVDGEEWLVEAKVLYQGNATQAVRAAVAQLFEYAYFFYPGSRRPRLMALFSEPVGSAFVELCSSLDIAAVWKGSAGWEGCQIAKRSGLVAELRQWLCPAEGPRLERLDRST